MPNTIQLIQTISADHTQVTVADATTYTLPTRSTCGVYLAAFKVDARGTEAQLSVTYDNSDPNFTASFSFPLTKDGHYRYKYIAPPDYNPSVSYNQYHAVFDPTSQKTYVSLVNSNLGNPLTSTTHWREEPNPISLVDLVGTIQEPANADTAVVNRVIGVLTADKRDKYAVDAALECCSDSYRAKNFSKFSVLDLFSVALIEADTSGAFNKGERIARRAEIL